MVLAAQRVRHDGFSDWNSARGMRPIFGAPHQTGSLLVTSAFKGECTSTHRAAS